MAFRRHELTQRRKAVGFTQESLAEHLGVERSTVIRWEAGDSEPLPSIRPSLARALQVSIDQLADLITRSEDVSAAGALSVESAETVPVPRSPDVAPTGLELVNAIHPQVAETVEALRRALRSAGVSTEDLAAMLAVDGSSTAPVDAEGSDVAQPPRSGSPTLLAPTAIPPDVEAGEVEQRRSGSQAGKRFAVAGLFVLALPAALLSPPFGLAPGGINPQAGAPALESAAPVFASSELNPGLDSVDSAQPADSPADIAAAPAVAPVDGPAAAPVPAAVPAPQSTRATSPSRTARRSTRSPAKPPPPSPREWLRPGTVPGDHWGDFGQGERFDHLW